MNLDTKALIGFFKEIEASRDRQKAETEFQRDVFKRAKEKHFDAKAMRIVLQRRAMDASKRDEQDYNVDCYERALAGKKLAVEALEQGATIREAAEAGGISTGSAAALAKGVQESSFLNTDIPFEITGGDIESFTEEDLRRLKIENDALKAKEQGDRQSPDDDLAIPSFLKRERVA